MMQILTNFTLKIKYAPNDNKSIPIELTDLAFNSFFGKEFSVGDRKFFSKPNFFFHHSYGFLKEDVINNSMINKFFNILGYYKTNNN